MPASGEVELDIALRPVPIPLMGVEVRTRVALPGLEHDEAGVYPDRRITIAAVRTHPQLPEPDVLQALTGAGVTARPETPDGLHVAGAASDQTAYVLDGIPVYSPYHAAGVFGAWNPDAIAGLELWSAARTAALPDALGGVVTAQTRRPGERFGSQGSLSTTQARLTMDGPLIGGGGWLAAMRTGYPGAPVSSDEASYVKGGFSDWLAKLEFPLARGQLRVLGYGNDNALDAAAGEGERAARAGRNMFEWQSRSHGVTWTRSVSGTTVHVAGWRARGAAAARWDGSAQLDAARVDDGIALSIARPTGRSRTLAGARVERRRTHYRVLNGADPAGPYELAARTTLFALFVQHARTVQPVGLEVAAALIGAGNDVHASPRVRAHWNPSDRLTVTGSWSLVQQFAQSLRNTESVVSALFPADLWVSGGTPGVPPASSRQGAVSIDYRPATGVRVGAHAWARRDRGLVLVAPHEPDPFPSHGFVVGAGSAHGASVEAAWSTTRYGLLASWGWQDVRLTHGDSSYVPAPGMRHVIDAGAIVFPSATSSIRVGATAGLGRRTSPVQGGFEWESCNLLDAGCEFAGSPRVGGGVPGSATMPSFLRVDIGARKHWHIELGGRDVQLALFGSLTNVFNRTNVMTWITEPATGDRTAIGMRPFAPLVVGADWRF
jgi:hypothetical protein